MRIGGFLLAALLTVLVPERVLAQQSQNWTWCDNENGTFSPDHSIRACTTIILSGTETQENLSAAYSNRGIAYRTKGDYNRAIADYNAAIYLDPSNSQAFTNRGNAHAYKGDFDRAVADYNEAIRLNSTDAAQFYNRGRAYRAKGDNDYAIADYTSAIGINPTYVDAFISRALAYRATGGFERAIADFGEAIRLDPANANAFTSRGWMRYITANYEGAASDLARAVELKSSYPYDGLWLYLARARSVAASETALGELGASAAKLKKADWPYPVVEFFLGRRTADATFAAASNPNDRCEAGFYIGEWTLLHGKPAASLSLLQLALSTCPKTFNEYIGAQAELKRLGRR